MSERYISINIRTYLDKDKPTYIGEERLYKLLSDFSSPKNPDIEHFLKHNAIEFTKKDQSVTYLVFNSNSTALVGYFTLAIKPLSIHSSSISKTMGKKLSRVSTLDKLDGTFTTSAYLIAQLGKNYSLPKEQRIDGTALLDLALDRIAQAQYSVGGIVGFLECEDCEILMQFYSRNNFKLFNVRTIDSLHPEEPRQLNQLLKLI